MPPFIVSVSRVTELIGSLDHLVIQLCRAACVTVRAMDSQACTTACNGGSRDRTCWALELSRALDGISCLCSNVRNPFGRCQLVHLIPLSGVYEVLFRIERELIF